MSEYFLHLLCLLGIYAVAAMSLNLVIGGAGLISLAHAAFLGIGAYAYAVSSIHGLGFLPAMLAGVLLAMLVSLALAIPAWRFRGDFFVLISLAVQALVFSALYNWHSAAHPVGTWQNLTNGPYGMAGIGRPDIFGIKFDSVGSLAALSLSLSVICGVICALLLKSPWWRMVTAIRDDEVAARSIGKNVRMAKVQLFAIASGMVAAAGAVYGSYFTYISPGMASLDEGILLLAMVLVGGSGNFRGPLVGAAILLLIPEVLRFMAVPSNAAANVRLLMYGLLLVVFMHFRGRGIAGDYRVE